MYITHEGHTYYAGSEQRHTKAPFLIIVQHKNKPLGSDNFRALVRKVALRQFGHWMMGNAKVKGHSITLSGSYGGDGLPVTIEHDEIYDVAIPIPRELYNKWNNGKGWNSCGNEASDMKEWAVKTFLVKKEFTFKDPEFYQGKQPNKYFIKRGKK